jgi:sterol 14-demethylase
MVSPPVSHRIESVYKNADDFDPDRFAKPREEDSVENGGRYSFIAFGRGRHACLGERFGYLQIKTIWCVFMRYYEFEPVVKTMPKPDHSAIVVGPTFPVMVRYKRRATPAW